MQVKMDINEYCRSSFNYNNNKNATQNYDVIVVGAGLSGAVIADRCARVLGWRVLILDQRDHIAGNCYDYKNQDGQLMNKYGLHLFHCNDRQTYDYIHQFSEWFRYDHRVVARVMLHGFTEYVPVPVNMETVNKLCGTNLQTPEEMDVWLSTHQKKRNPIENGEDAALSRVGPDLYRILFETYTIKQWAKKPSDLDRSVLERIPVRRDMDPRYFSDRFQLLPRYGYTAFVASILNHPLITVQLNTDFFEFQKLHPTLSVLKWLVYTGPIDRFFVNAGLPKLEYRSIRFEEERVKNAYFILPNVVVNEPGADVEYTRTVEYKHLPYNRDKGPHTTLVREYTTDVGEPFYPVPDLRNQSLYEQYRVLAEEAEAKKEKKDLPRVLFVGRLANYKYKNMNDAIRDALEMFESKMRNE
jgi:UDP-galactopyranose mutase